MRQTMVLLMRSENGIHGACKSTELPCPSHERWLARRCVFAIAGVAVLYGALSVDCRAQEMPPETTPRALRHNGPPSAPAVAPTGQDSQPLGTQGNAVSHRRGMPPNVILPSTDPSSSVGSTSGAVPPSQSAVSSSVPASAPLSQLPASRARVRVSATETAVQADNSSLSQVLRDIANATGMKVEGLSRDERVFGNYGPGTPREVLMALLDGANYNVLMISEGASGAPRQLILSQRNSGAASTPGQPANPADPDDAEPDQGDQEPEAVPSTVLVEPNIQRPEGAAGDGVIRTPQQLLEQMQRARELQQQQPPPPQN